MLRLLAQQPWLSPRQRLNSNSINPSVFGGEKRPLRHLAGLVSIQMTSSQLTRNWSFQPATINCCHRSTVCIDACSSRGKSTMTFSERIAAARAKRTKINDQRPQKIQPSGQHHRRLPSSTTEKITPASDDIGNSFHRLQREPIFATTKNTGEDSSNSFSGRVFTNNDERYSSKFKSRGPSKLDFKICRSIDDAIVMTYNRLDERGHLSTSMIAAFWSNVPHLLNNISNHGRCHPDEVATQLQKIIQFTEKNIESFNQRYLTQTLLGLAKAAKELKESMTNSTYNHSVHRALRNFFCLNNLNQSNNIFCTIAVASRQSLSNTEPQFLANQAYAYFLVQFVPRFEDGTSLFDHIAKESVLRLRYFNSQDFSNLVHAYAKVGEKDHYLFQQVEREISSRNNLSEFQPQHLSNIVLAFAKHGGSHPHLFETIGNAIVTRDNLNSFNSQHLSNIVWAFAKIGASHPGLFRRIADEIVNRSLRDFAPQALSNIIWAFATADIPHPILYQKVGDEIISLENIHQFEPQHLANILFAFSVTETKHQVLFQSVGDHIVSLHDLSDFQERHFVMILVSFAKNEVTHPRLFQKVGNHIATSETDLLESFDASHVYQIAWAFATSREVHPELFQKFEKAVDKRKIEFSSQEISVVRWACSLLRNK